MSEEIKKSTLTPEDVILINDAFTEGIDGGIRLFIKKHKLATEKGATGLDTHWVLAQHIVGEFPMFSEGVETPSEYAYPFTESLKASIDATMLQATGHIAVLIRHEENDTIKQLCRVISCNVTLEFLDRNSAEVIKFYEGLKVKKQ